MSEKVAVLVYVEPEVKEKLQQMADRNDWSLSAEGRRAIKLHVRAFEEGRRV